MPSGSDHPDPTGPLPQEGADDAPNTKPPRRQTMEVQAAWLEARENEPAIEPLAAPVLPEEETARVVVPPRRPPRLPGARVTIPAMPPGTKPPPPPPRKTQEVEMTWVELVEDDLQEVPESVPSFAEPEDRGEVTRVADEGVSAQRLEEERALARAQQDEGPVIPDDMGTERAAELTSATQAEEEEAEKAYKEALAARQAEQDERDRKIRERRKAERERERLEEEAREARRLQSAREEAERAAAAADEHERPTRENIDLAGIDGEIDNALDSVLGSNLSYPPPPPDDDPGSDKE